MKVKDLLLRRTQLKEQKESILKQINEMTASMERKELEKFIETGESGQVDGHQLDKLQRKRKQLVLLGGSLDKEILKANEKEKAKEKARILKEANEFAQVRERLQNKIRHHLTKIEKLREESRAIHSEEHTLRSLLNKKDMPTSQVTLRLNLMEKFLKEHIILGTGEQEILEKVLKARTHNKRILAQPRIGINDKIFRNFEVEWDTKTLELLKFEFVEREAESCLRNLDRKNSLTKAEFLKEVC